MKTTLTARRMRVLLIIAMLLIIIFAVLGFLFARKNLTDYAAAISSLNADAQTGDQNIQTLKNLEERLKRERATIEDAKNVVADGSNYSDKVIADLSRIAQESGINVKSFVFSDGGSAAQTPPAATAPQPAAPTVAPSGIVKKTVTIDIQSPLSYTNFMTFLQKIEANDLKMQVSGVSMTKDTGNNIAAQSLSIEVSIRQ